MAEDDCSNCDVTEASGYMVEGKVRARNSDGWGGTPTRLPAGHLARRDSSVAIKTLRENNSE
jgi:hypothetical protein